MIVVLDANVLVADFPMGGNQFRILLAGRRLVGAEIYVPAVAVEEVVNRFRETSAEQSQVIERSLGRLKAIGITKAKLSGVGTADDEAAAYRETLTALFKANEIKTIPIPNVDTQEIIARDLSRKKPFGKPSGYRDYLIWKSVLGLAYKSEPIAFVTQNTADFADQGTLHPDLAADVAARWPLNGRLELYQSLNDFNAQHVSPVLDRGRELADLLKERGLPDIDLQDWASSHLGEILTDDDLLIHGLGVESPDVGSAGLPKLTAALTVTIDDIYETGASEFVVAARLVLPIRFSISFDYHDMMRSERLRDVFGEDDEPFSSASADWENELEVNGSFRISGDPPAVELFEVEDIDARWT